MSGAGNAVEHLIAGEMTLVDRLLTASNATFLVDISDGETSVRAVYKPVRGERPLWDFPDGTLAAREVAAYRVSEALGWQIVPDTVLRDGPHGVGMVQRWVTVTDEDPVAVVDTDAVPAGHHRVLDAYTARDERVALVHEDSASLRRMAIFDVVINNTDRKGGHVLPVAGGHRYGVDHGVTFHVEPKLRTVLWGWEDQPIPNGEMADLQRLACDPGLLAELSELLTPDEVHAFVRRVERLVRRGRMPGQDGSWQPFPWPLF